MKKLILYLIIAFLFIIAFFPTIGKLTNSYVEVITNYELETLNETEYSVTNNTVTMALTEDITTDPISLIPVLPLYNDSFTMMINGSFLSVAETFTYEEMNVTDGSTTAQVTSVSVNPNYLEYVVSKGETPYFYVSSLVDGSFIYSVLPYSSSSPYLTGYPNTITYGRYAQYNHEGDILAISHTHTTTYLTLYDTTTTPYTAIARPSSLPHTYAMKILFSYDDQYMIYLTQTSPYVYVYDTSTIPYTLISNPITDTITGTLYDGNTSNTSANYLTFSTTNMTLMYDMTTLPFTSVDISPITYVNARAFAFSNNDQYLVLSEPTVKYHMYDITSSPFTEVTLPSDMISSQYRDAEFSYDDNFLLLSGSASNNLRLYDITTDPFTLLPLNMVFERQVNDVEFAPNRILVALESGYSTDYSFKMFSFDYSPAYFRIYNNTDLLYSLNPNQSYIDEEVTIGSQSLENIIISTNKIDNLSTSNIEIEFIFEPQYLENESVFTPLIRFMPLVAFIVIVTIAVAYVSHHKN